MPSWDCLKCGRRFAKTAQSHLCAPALTLEEYFSTGPAFERPIFESVLRHVQTLGSVVVEPVSVGIFLKRARSFAELRPMTKWVALWFSLDRTVSHPLITKKVVQYGGRYFHVANLRSPGEVDDSLRGWLTEAYLDAPPE